ncbi:lytic transglycosylase domain-containing protein [Pectobacterium carotovorum]|uniref:lytic transglycosylase domain-containing protein n=1 Tax=Pectobacterium carotovorum TaxID=554 RepID=UPI0021C4AD68|nr:lytic transglycosylase domain-containing protein [Pectobacterium carotovorum]GKW07663.1 lytic transglycosylase [Pectobacterium carotovorum subsp. carotovorum]
MCGRLCLALLFQLSWAGAASAFCFDAAGAKYQVDTLLVKAIAEGESSLNPEAVNINRDKETRREVSRDYGLMQVNSTHIPNLISMGVIQSPKDLLTKPCLNVQIGTWILAKHFQVCGISWNCLGSYNAGFRNDRHETREAYANRIYKRYKRLLKEERGIVLP